MTRDELTRLDQALTTEARRARADFDAAARRLRELFSAAIDQGRRCEGHPDGPVMGETFFCDGTCQASVVCATCGLECPSERCTCSICECPACSAHACGGA